MKLKDLIFENVPEQFEKQVAPTAAGINKVIDSIDDSMHYGVFAKAVAKVLKDEYGSHNIKPFMDILHKELGMNEGAVAVIDKDEIAAQLSQEHPNLTFSPSLHSDRIDVIGREQAKWDFAQAMAGKDIHGYKVFDVDDDDRGLIVRLIPA